MISRRNFLKTLSVIPLAGMLDGTVLGSESIRLPGRGLCAHRGCSDTFPENTLPAFREAIRLGAQMIEFDVQETRDGVLVIMHDGDVKRTTNGKGKVSQLTFDEIRKLDAGIHKGAQFANTLVPTFEEVLEMMPKNVWLNCDMKARPASLAEKSARLIVAKGRQHQAFLACYDAAMREAARRVFPDIMICNMERKPTTREYVEDTVTMKAQFIQFTSKKYDKNQLSDKDLLPLKQNHIRANFFPLNEPDELKGLFEKGIEFALVNKLADFLPAAHQLGILPVVPEY